MNIFINCWFKKIIYRYRIDNNRSGCSGYFFSFVWDFVICCFFFVMIGIDLVK